MREVGVLGFSSFWEERGVKGECLSLVFGKKVS